MNEGIVQRISWKEMGDSEAHLGHANLLDTEHEEEKEEAVIGHIIASFQWGCPISPKQIDVFAGELFNQVEFGGWLWHFVHQHCDGLDHAKVSQHQMIRITFQNRE
jgi:hypothetical protein